MKLAASSARKRGHTMLVQPKGNTNVREQFHVPSGIGKALIATGVIEEVIPAAKVLLPVKWSANLGSLQGQYPPVVRATCPNCGKTEYTESNKGAAHEMTFPHCQGVERYPREVALQYQDLWRRWQKEFQSKELLDHSGRKSRGLVAFLTR
jgi:hypothetical protein